jgi:hypothetical protein
MISSTLGALGGGVIRGAHQGLDLQSGILDHTAEGRRR